MIMPTFSVNTAEKQGFFKTFARILEGKDINSLKSDDLDTITTYCLEKSKTTTVSTIKEETITRVEKEIDLEEEVSNSVGLGRIKYIQKMRRKHETMKDVELKEDMVVIDEDVVDIIYKKDYEGIMIDFYKFEIKMYVWEGISIERLMQLVLLYEDKKALKKIQQAVEYMSDDETTKDAIRVILTDSVLADMIKDNGYMTRFKSKCYRKAYDLVWDNETKAHREFRLAELSKRAKWRAENPNYNFYEEE